MKKNIISYLSISIVFAIFLFSCEKEESGIQALSLKEAVYVSGANNMTISLKEGETLQVTPFVMPRSAAIPPLSYSNRHPEILSVSQEGLITPKAVGVDTLTVSALDGSKISVSYVVEIVKK